MTPEAPRNPPGTSNVTAPMGTGDERNETMVNLILGPVGALPPGEWAMGARCYPGDVVIVNTYQDGTVDVHDVDDGSVNVRREGLSLDITAGCLSHACRAFLAAVAPEARQPDCAPTWRRESGHPHPEGWREARFVLACGGRRHVFTSEEPYAPGVYCVRGISAETCLRRALERAMEAAAGGAS